MKNVEQNENSPIEIIEETLKILRTNEIYARIEAQTPGIKGWEGGKAKVTWGRMKQTPLRKLRVDLADVETDRIHLKRSTPVGKELT